MFFNSSICQEHGGARKGKTQSPASSLFYVFHSDFHSSKSYTLSSSEVYLGNTD